MIRYGSAVFAAVALMAVPALAGAHDYKLGSIEVLHPWTRATPPGAATAAGYLQVRNDGADTDYLIGAQGDGFERVEIHQMQMRNGVMKMRKVSAEGVAIAPGTTVTLAPSGYHLMLIGPKAQLKAGEKRPVSLTFKSAGTIKVEFVVEGMGSHVGTPPAHMNAGGMTHERAEHMHDGGGTAAPQGGQDE